MERESGETPRALAERPRLFDHLIFEWRAFFALLSDRTPGLHGSVPFSSVDRYAARFGPDDPDGFDRFHTLMAAMCAAFSEALASRAPPPTKH